MKNIRKIRAEYVDLLDREKQPKGKWTEGAYVEFEDRNGLENVGKIVHVVDNIGREPYYQIEVEDDDGGRNHTIHIVDESKIIGEG